MCAAASAGAGTRLGPRCRRRDVPSLAAGAVARAPRVKSVRKAACAALGGFGPLGDPHRVLGVEPGADQATIKKAFRRLALRFHPDVSHADGAQEHFQAVQHAYDTLVERHHEVPNADASAWPRRRRPPPDEPAAPAAPEAPPTPEQQQERWKQQLGGLGQRAAAQRERRESEKRYRAAMREHAVRGSFSGVASTDAGHERLQSQLSDLYAASAGAGGGALGSRAQAPPEAHMLSAHASGLARAAQAADDASAAPPPPPPPLSATEKEVMQQLVRLARVAQTWRVVSGLEPAAAKEQTESLTPGE